MCLIYIFIYVLDWLISHVLLKHLKWCENILSNVSINPNSVYNYQVNN